MKIKIIFLFLICFPLFASAAGGELSVKTVLIQLFNFSLFAGALLFLIRRPLQAFFHKRRKDFISFEEQAKQLEKEKKAEEKKWDEKLKDLNLQEQNIRAKAEEEGKKFQRAKEQNLKELKSQHRNMAEFLIRLERQKAKKHLLQKWKGKTAERAGEDLKEHIKSPAFQASRLENFLKQVELKS